MTSESEKKYYVMIDDERHGPYTLEQLMVSGIRPDTYVWCKGMSDWQPAEEVADICRGFRQRLSGLQHPLRSMPQPVPPTDVQEAPPTDQQSGFLSWRSVEPEFDPAEHDPGEPPPPGILPLAIIVTVFCFPFTGIIAIYHAIRARKAWQEALRSSSREAYKLYNQAERDDIRQEMSSSVRACKMWTGISFFLGLLVYASLIRMF